MNHSNLKELQDTFFLKKNINVEDENLRLAVCLLAAVLRVSICWYTSPSRDRLGVLQVGVLKILFVFGPSV